MLWFRQYVASERHPDLAFLLPLRDDGENKYATAEEVAIAIRQGKRLFALIELGNGEQILDRLLNDDDWSLEEVGQNVESALKACALKLAPGQSFVLEGAPLMCKGRSVNVFGGYGLNDKGQPWACERADTHGPADENLVKALVEHLKLSEDEAEFWRQGGKPDDCTGEHFYAPML